MVPLVAPNGAVLGVTLLDEGQQGIKKPFLYHGLSREGILLSETGRIFTVTRYYPVHKAKKSQRY
jgi:hypothetical protein